MSDHAPPPLPPVIDLPPSVADPDTAVQFLVSRLQADGRLKPGDEFPVLAAVRRREQLGTTALGSGIAVPHARTDTVSELVGLVGRAATPFEWPGALDGGPVKFVCLLLVPPNGAGQQLRALEGIVSRLRELP